MPRYAFKRLTALGKVFKVLETRIFRDRKSSMRWNFSDKSNILIENECPETYVENSSILVIEMQTKFNGSKAHKAFLLMARFFGRKIMVGNSKLWFPLSK